jgi:hypothetical protein
MAEFMTGAVAAVKRGKNCLKTRLVSRLGIAEPGYFSVKLKIDSAGRSMPLLTDNYLSFSVYCSHLILPFLVFGSPGTRLLVHQIVFLTVDEQHDIRVLLNGARLPQI